MDFDAGDWAAWFCEGKFVGFYKSPHEFIKLKYLWINERFLKLLAPPLWIFVTLLLIPRLFCLFWCPSQAPPVSLIKNCRFWASLNLRTFLTSFKATPISISTFSVLSSNLSPALPKISNKPTLIKKFLQKIVLLSLETSFP